jgi:hypothetical protein
MALLRSCSLSEAVAQLFFLHTGRDADTSRRVLFGLLACSAAQTWKRSN